MLELRTYSFPLVILLGALVTVPGPATAQDPAQEQMRRMQQHMDEMCDRMEEGLRIMDPPLNLGVAAGYRLANDWSMSTGVTVGLTESAADVAIYLGWSRGLRDGF